MDQLCVKCASQRLVLYNGATRNNIVAMPMDKKNVKWNIQYQVEMATRVVSVKNSIDSCLNRSEVKASAVLAPVQLGCYHYVSYSLHCPHIITFPVWFSCFRRKRKTGLMWRRLWESTVSALMQGFSGDGFTSLGWQSPVDHVWFGDFLFVSRIKVKILFTIAIPPILFFLKFLWNMKEKEHYNDDYKVPYPLFFCRQTRSWVTSCFGCVWWASPIHVSLPKRCLLL